MENIILGGGIAGLAAHQRLQENRIFSKCYEQDRQCGGLCASFSIEGFTFDKFVHLSFTSEEEVKTVFSAATEYITHQPEAMNYADGMWIRHPVQNNLCGLPVKEKVEIIKSFISKPEAGKIGNYEDWLRAQYGDYFAEKYPMRYTRKYWGVNADEMGTDWVGERMFVPELEKILYSAFVANTENVYYAKEMRYPVRGGFFAFLARLADSDEIFLNKKMIRIDEKEKTVYFEDGDIITYDNLISTCPLPEIVDCLQYADQKIKEAADRLMYTSGYIISIGLNKQKCFPSLWFYIYDEDILPARVHSPSMKSINNVPEGKSSLQAEIYFTGPKWTEKKEEDILNQTILKLVSMGLFSEDDVEIKDIRFMKYANVICDKAIDENRKIVTDYLDANGIITAGRFGEWKYFWSDQSYLSGSKAADILMERIEKNVI